MLNKITLAIAGTLLAGTLLADDLPRIPLYLDMVRPLEAYSVTAGEGTTPGVRCYLMLNGSQVTNLIEWTGSLYTYAPGSTNEPDESASTNCGPGYIDFDMTTNQTGSAGTYKSQIILRAPGGQRVLEWSRGRLTVTEAVP